METRIYHGSLLPNDLAKALIAQFNRGSLRAQQVGDTDKIIVQIATSDRPSTGGDTAISIQIQKVEDGVAVQVGKQEWLGVAASLGFSAFTAIRNPIGLINRLDDIAQDIENLQLTERVWASIENSVKITGASFDLSDRLKRLVCDYCNTANPIGEPSCIACGAPLGNSQPCTCPTCGYVVTHEEASCPNCGKIL